MYYFKPSKKFRKFKQYYVLITPKTKLIYLIWAIAPIKEEQKFLREQEVVLNILEKKYGPAQDETKLFEIKDKHNKAIYNNGRFIYTRYLINFMGTNKFHLQYVDIKLSEQAKEEYIELEAEKDKGADI